MTAEQENKILRRAMRETQGRPCPRYYDEGQWSAYKRLLQWMMIQSDKLLKEEAHATRRAG